MGTLSWVLVPMPFDTAYFGALVVCWLAVHTEM